MRNRLLLYLLVISIPLYLYPAVPFGPEPIRWDWLVILALVGSFTVELVRDPTGPTLRLDRPQLWLLIFLMFVVLSVARPALTGGPRSLIDYATTTIQLAMNAALFVVLAHMDSDERSTRSILRLYLLVAVGIAGFAIAQSLLANLFGNTSLFPFTWTSLTYPDYFPFKIGTPGRYHTLGLYRATSIFAEPRHLGNFLVTPFLLGVVALWFPRPTLFRYRWPLLLSTAILSVGIVVSVSASAFLVLGVGLVALPLLTLDEPRRIVRGYILGGFVSGFVVSAGYAMGVMPIIRTIGRFVPRQRELRLFMDFGTPVMGPVKYLRGMFLALREAAAHPFFGVGMNQVYTSIDVGAPITIVPPFLLLAAIGIPGFLAFVAFLSTAFSNIVRARYHDRSMMTCWLLTVSILLFGMAVVKSLFGSKYNYPNTWFWFEVGFAYMIYTNTFPMSLDASSPARQITGHMQTDSET